MKTIVAILVSLLFSSVCFGEDLTKNEVLSFIEKVDRSFKTRNEELLNSTISKDVIIKGITLVNGESKEFQISGEQYISSISQAWQNYESYSYEKLDTKVKSMDKKQAIVSDSVIEKFSINSEKYEVKSKVEISLEKSENIIHAVKLIINSKLEKI